MGQLNERQCRMLLAATSEPGDLRIGRLIQTQGVENLLKDVERLPESTKGLLSKTSLDSIEAAMNACSADFLIPSDDEWPVGLNLLAELAPIGLWKIGAAPPPPLTVSIVGARSCTSYGESVATNLAAELNQLDVGVVSGGAFGIDAAAHRGAVLSNGLTIAVLAGGVDVPYPRANARLFEKIAETGWLVSESPPGSPPLKHRFLIRNRLIAAWSLGTVVVEARIRSGAISTASHANNLGLEVMAVPGPINAAASTGSNQLIRDGATLVTNATEVLRQLRPISAS